MYYGRGEVRKHTSMSCLSRTFTSSNLTIPKHTYLLSSQGCWHEVSCVIFLKFFHDHALDERDLQVVLHFFTNATCWIKLSPLSKLPTTSQWEFGSCLSPSVVDLRKRLAKHHEICQPLSGQLPNTTQAH